MHLINDAGNALPIANIEISIQFLMQGRRIYQFTLGLTDSSGGVTASYADLESKRRRESQFSVMDYNTRLEDTDSSVKILLESDQEICKRREYTNRIYGRLEAETEGERSNALVKPQVKFVELSETATVVQLQTERV